LIFRQFPQGQTPFCCPVTWTTSSTARHERRNTGYAAGDETKACASQLPGVSGEDRLRRGKESEERENGRGKLHPKAGRRREGWYGTHCYFPRALPRVAVLDERSENWWPHAGNRDYSIRYLEVRFLRNAFAPNLCSDVARCGGSRHGRAQSWPASPAEAMFREGRSTAKIWLSSAA
jgi:hypothetical protein